IAALAACPELQHLELTGRMLSDAGMQAIAAQKWSALHTLHLMCREVTDAGLEPLFRSGIAWHAFSCTCPKPTDACLITFGKHAVTEQLVEFGLVNCPITDVGLKALVQKPFPKLLTLAISDTKVTDAGIQQLSRLRSLKSMSLPEKTVTPAGVAKLKSALPGCNIEQIDLYSEE
ncbi:MAG: serine/threonine protein kinase, partial [Planctomycetaceae bacterium]|nr:serine/threonine protein kinase [Planctomycetaceae bacterium]